MNNCKVQKKKKVMKKSMEKKNEKKKKELFLKLAMGWMKKGFIWDYKARRKQVNQSNDILAEKEEITWI